MFLYYVFIFLRWLWRKKNFVVTIGILFTVDVVFRNNWTRHIYKFLPFLDQKFFDHVIYLSWSFWKKLRWLFSIVAAITKLLFHFVFRNNWMQLTQNFVVFCRNQFLMVFFGWQITRNKLIKLLVHFFVITNIVLFSIAV